MAKQEPTYIARSPTLGQSQRQRFAILVHTFTFQVRTGCGRLQPACGTPTCFTFRQSTCQTPLRRHTTLAANAIALVLAGRNDAAQYICPYLPMILPAAVLDIPERIDDAALSQRLSCTTSIQQCCNIGYAGSTLSKTGDLPICVSDRYHTISDKDLSEICAWVDTPVSLLPEKAASRRIISKFLEDLISTPDRLKGSLYGSDTPDLRVAMELTASSRLMLVATIERVAHYLNKLWNLLPASFFDSLSQSLRRLEFKPDQVHEDFKVIFACFCAIGLEVSSGGPGDLSETFETYAATELAETSRRCILQLVEVAEESSRRTLRMRLSGDRRHTIECAPATSLRTLLVTLLSATEGGLDPLSDEQPMWPFRQFLSGLRQLFAAVWDGSPFIEIGSSLWTILHLLSQIEDYAPLTTAQTTWDHEFDVEEACRTVLEPQKNHRHILSWTCLSTREQQWHYLRTVCYYKMRQATKPVRLAEQSKARFHAQFQDRGGVYLERRMKLKLQYYLILRIRRQSLLSDAFDQLWHRERQEIHRPLRIRLLDHELEFGVDQGGVQVEFFNVLCGTISEAANPLFDVDLGSNMLWFRAGSLEPLYRYELLGILLGLALHNGITLPLSFPLAFYKKLMGHKTCLQDLRDRWPEQYRNLDFVNNYKGGEIDELGLEHTFALKANGLVLGVDMTEYAWHNVPDGTDTSTVPVHSVVLDDHRGPKDAIPNGVGDKCQVPKGKLANPVAAWTLAWPGWSFVPSGRAPESLRSKDRRAYVEEYANWILDYSIRPQFYAFARGFFRVIDISTLHLTTPSNLQALMEGRSTFTAADLIAQVTFMEYEPGAQHVEWFKSIVGSYDQDRLLKLLEFVTASKRLPPHGASPIQFCVQRSPNYSLDQLPSSSTCFGTLSMPDYESREVMERKLDIAITESIGFGLA